VAGNKGSLESAVIYDRLLAEVVVDYEMSAILNAFVNHPEATCLPNLTCKGIEEVPSTCF
jgi:hypothetical protein